MDAVLYVKKQSGMTSFDVVSACRKIFHERRIGHTGTLDPNASGLMILLLGKYTKFLPYCIKDHKTYTAQFSFGTKTDTQDCWGNVLEKSTPKPHDLSSLQKTLDSMMGESFQVPPMYSAIKKDGKKLYEYARQGKEVEREPRRIYLEDGVVAQESENTYTLKVTVSSGTYIRTLISDFAEKCGEFAMMTSLVRESIEQVSLAQAQTLEELQENPVFHPIQEVLDPSLPIVSTNVAADVRNGKPIELESDAPLVLIEEENSILAAYRKGQNHQYVCQRGLF